MAIPRTVPDLWTTKPSEEALQRTVKALEANQVHFKLVADGAAAKRELLALIPAGAEVMNVTSTTLDQIGASGEFARAGRYVSVRERLAATPKEQLPRARREQSHPDWVVGSVHAVTEAGEVVVASQSGSQLPFYAFTAANVVWVVGEQKIVKDLAAAERRVFEHALPLESARAQKAYGMGSAVNFLLTIRRAPRPGRITMLLVRETLGF
ncbi:MAG: LUD domain-containing protein [Thermoplasmatota archaeon]